MDFDEIEYLEKTVEEAEDREGSRKTKQSDSSEKSKRSYRKRDADEDIEAEEERRARKSRGDEENGDKSKDRERHRRERDRERSSREKERDVERDRDRDRDKDRDRDRDRDRERSHREKEKERERERERRDKDRDREKERERDRREGIVISNWGWGREREREMAKFSVGGEEDGEGRSTFRGAKRQKTTSSSSSRPSEQPQQQSNPQTQRPPPQVNSPLPPPPTPMEAEPEIEEEEADDERQWVTEEEQEANGNNQVALAGPRSSIGSCLLGPTTRPGAISVTLTDPEVLDCPICYEPLTIPVFQCDNGHTACSSCCSKLLQKCPSCSLPIGYNRCRAMEKVLESVRIPCPNMKYGCKEIVGYSKKNGHEETCHYVPCSCPQSGCSFIGSSNQVYKHYSTKHMLTRIRFPYNHPSPVFLTTSQKFLVFQEEKEGVLFILYNKEEILGNMMTVCCIGPPSLKGGYFYELTVKTVESSLKLRSLTKTIQGRVNDPPSAAFLLVPGEFFGSYGQISLDLCIWRHGEHPSLV